MSKNIQNLSRSGRPKGSKNKKYSPTTVVKHLDKIGKSLDFVTAKTGFSERALHHYNMLYNYVVIALLDDREAEAMFLDKVRQMETSTLKNELLKQKVRENLSKPTAE